jgi:hypothetical protein
MLRARMEELKGFAVKLQIPSAKFQGITNYKR